MKIRYIIFVVRIKYATPGAALACQLKTIRQELLSRTAKEYRGSLRDGGRDLGRRIGRGRRLSRLTT